MVDYNVHFKEKCLDYFKYIDFSRICIPVLPAGAVQGKQYFSATVHSILLEVISWWMKENTMF